MAVAQSVIDPLPRPSRAAGARGALALILLCAISYLPGIFSLPPVDRDESRFAQASKQMLRSDDLKGWAVPMVGETPRLNKPPLIYWLQAGSAALMGDRALRDHPATGGIGAYRLPSALCGCLAALATWRLGLSMFGRRHARAAWLAGAMLASCFIVTWDAHQARADQLLLAVTTAAMWALWACWKSTLATAAGTKPSIPVRSVLTFWLLIGLGVMSKGPITPMVALLASVGVSAVTGRWRWLLSMRPWIGVPLALVCIVPWVFLVGREVGWEAYLSIIQDEVLGRSVSPSEGHWGPPGYHVVLLPLMFWPGSMLTAAGIALAWMRVRRQVVSVVAAGPTGSPPRGIRAWLDRFHNDHPAEVFLLVWLIPGWLVFEFISTKLPHYPMPLYPALALLSARSVMLASSSTEAAGALGLHKPAPKIGLALWWVIGIAVAVAAPIGLTRFGGLRASGGTMMLTGALTGAACGALLVAGLGLRRGHYLRAQCSGLLAMCIASIVNFGIILPRLHAPWISPRLAEIIRRADPESALPIAAIGYHEDSLKFLTDGRMVRLGHPKLAEWISGHPRAIIVLPTNLVDQAEAALGHAYEELGRTSGFRYSKGDWVDVTVLRVEPSDGYDSNPG